jgi:tetratricopeptide (TPR) repeat protein
MSGLKDGLRPRIDAFFKRAARRISSGNANFDELRPVLEFLARGYPPAWLLLSELEQEVGGKAGLKRAAEAVRRYLETQPPSLEAVNAWQRLVFLYRAVGDVIGGCSAFLKAAELNDPPLNEISSIANWLNNSPEAKDRVDLVDRKALFKPFARMMEAHLSEASATDLSRLAWLHLHSGDSDRALTVAEIGLRRDPDNAHCQRLEAKLNDI